MKRLVTTFLTILTCGAAYALPFGNPSEASLFLNGTWWETSCCDPCDPCFSWCDSWSIRLGFSGDYVFDRHMEKHNGSDVGCDIETTTIHTNAGYLALNICDRLDLFSRLGTSRLHIRANANAWSLIIFDIPSVESELDFRTEFSWSIGGRATLWECDCFAIGLEGEYFQTKPDIDYFLGYFLGQLNHFGDSPKAKYNEWQIGMGLSYRFETSCPTIAFVPYIGIDWSCSKLDMGDAVFEVFDIDEETTGTLHNLRSKKPWGYAIGMTFTLCEMIGVGVEGRFASEKALYINGQARF